MSEAGTNIQDVRATYQRLPDDALLEIASEGGLTSAAQSALKAEMERRSLGPKDVQSFEQWRKETAPQPPPPTPQRTFDGYGIGYVGKKTLTQSVGERSGSFVTTRFLMIRGLTTIPLGSYRAIEGRGGYPKVEERVSMQWDQVWQGMRVFLFATLTGLALAAVSIYFAESRRR